MYGYFTMSTALTTLILYLYISYAVALSQYSQQGWEKASNYLRSGLNPHIDPCDDFYEHVCGNFGANDGRSRLSAAVEAEEEIMDILKQAVTKINATNPKTVESRKSLKFFIDECEKVHKVENYNESLLDAISKRFGAISRSGPADQGATSPQGKWWFIGSVYREASVTILSRFKVRAERLGHAKENSRALIFLSPVLSLRACGTGSKNRRVILDHLITSGKLKFSVATDDVLEEIDELCKELSNVTVSTGPECLEIESAETVAPDFPWRAYLDGLNMSSAFIDDGMLKVFLSEPRFFQNVSIILESYSESAIQAWAMLEVTEAAVDEAERYRQYADPCYIEAMKMFPPVLATLYFEHTKQDIHAWRHDLLQLGRYVISAFRLLLVNVQWLDAEEKEKVQEKVDDIALDPGIPEWITDEDEIFKRIPNYDLAETFFDNQFQGRKFIFENVLDRIQTGKFERSYPSGAYGYPSFEVNAKYYDASNSIHMCLGHSLPPLYSMVYPLAVKFGVYGSVVGHELMHAFDRRGIEYGPITGDKDDWLKETTLELYKKTHECLARQYSSHCRNGKCINGEETLNEDIADIAGLKIAYTAFKFATQIVAQEPPIPNMHNYTQDQIFFIAMARGWCVKGDQGSDNVHSPHRARVQEVLPNIPVFAKAFRCPIGTRYAPLKPCDVWGDMSNPVKKKK